MAQDPLSQVKITIRQAVALANANAQADPAHAAAWLNMAAMLSPLVGTGTTLEKATTALLQCRAALAPAANGLSAVGAVQQAQAQGATPAGYVGSTTAAGIALGALVVGAGAGFAGGKWFGKRKAAPKTGARENPLGAAPTRMRPGYAAKWNAEEGDWRDGSAPRNVETMRFVERREVQGETMLVFSSPAGALYAQPESMHREPLALGEHAGA